MKVRHTLLRNVSLGLVLCLALLVLAGPATGETASNLGKLAYISDGDLWVRTLPDGEPKQVTSGGGNNSPLWSPSGEWIALRRSDDRVWVMRDTGEGATALEGSSAGGMYAWSPVTDTLAFTTPKGNLGVASAPDWRVQPVVTAQGEQVYFSHFAWSPDGEWLAFSEDHSLRPPQAGEPSQLYASLQKIHPDGRDRTELLNAGNPSVDGLELAGWSRDGSQIYYWPDPDFSASLLADGSELKAVSTDGAVLTRTLTAATLLYPDFWIEAPDGRSVGVVEGFGRETWSHKRVAVVDRSSGQLTYLTDSDTAAISPAWSPDGERIAYVAAPDFGFVGGGPPAKAGAAERRIWIMNKDGSGKHALTNDEAFRDELPQWSRDGQFILFARLNAADEASLWLVSAAGGTPQQVAGGLVLDPLTTWFGYYGYIDWTRDFDWWRGR